MKRAVWLVFSVLLATVAGGQQNRIPQIRERDILDARTIAVVAYSSQSAGADAQENQRARLAVQEALHRWGRYEIVEATVADLIVLVRKGHAQTATIGGTIGTPPVVLGPLDSGTGISIHRGQDPPLSRTDPSQASGRRRVGGSEGGSPDDLLEVYLGRTPLPGDASRNATQYPLDEPPVWFYAANDALTPPKIEAVAVFRKAVEAAEKKKR